MYKLYYLLIVFLISCSQANKENKYYSILLNKDYECTYWYSSNTEDVMEFCKTDTTHATYTSDEDLLIFKDIFDNPEYIKPKDTWFLKGDTVFFDKKNKIFFTIISLDNDRLVIKPRNKRYGETIEYKKIENGYIHIKKELLIHPRAIRELSN